MAPKRKSVDFLDVRDEIYSMMFETEPPQKDLQPFCRSSTWAGGMYTGKCLAIVSRAITLPYYARLLLYLAHRCALYKIASKSEIRSGYKDGSYDYEISQTLRGLNPDKGTVLPIVTANPEGQNTIYPSSDEVRYASPDDVRWRVILKKFGAMTDAGCYPRGSDATIFAPEIHGSLCTLPANCCYLFSSEVWSGFNNFGNIKFRSYEIVESVRDMLAASGGYSGVIGIWATQPNAALTDSTKITESGIYKIHRDSLYNMRYEVSGRSHNRLFIRTLGKNGARASMHDNVIGNWQIWMPNPKTWGNFLESTDTWRRLLKLTGTTELTGTDIEELARVMATTLTREGSSAKKSG